MLINFKGKGLGRMWTGADQVPILFPAFLSSNNTGQQLPTEHLRSVTVSLSVTQGEFDAFERKDSGSVHLLNT